MEDVEIARDKDEAIESLCDEGYTLGGVVTVDCEDQDAFREGVGKIPCDAERLVILVQSHKRYLG